MADKLISADALIDIIGTTFTDREHGNPHFFNGLATAVEIIKNAEEAVVRCKDCKHISRCGVDDWFFCAEGERREEG